MKRTRATITDDVRDNILFLARKSISVDKIAELVGVSSTSVSSILRAYRLITQKEPFDLAAAEADPKIKSHLTWAFKQLDITYPPTPESLEADKRRHAAANVQSAAPKTTTGATEAGESIKKKDTEKANEDLYLSQILMSLRQQNELFEQLLDTVIPHWANDIKDNLNANFDALSAQVEAAAKTLDGIKCNTRKRGL